MSIHDPQSVCIPTFEDSEKRRITNSEAAINHAVISATAVEEALPGLTESLPQLSNDAGREGHPVVESQRVTFVWEELDPRINPETGNWRHTEPGSQ